MPAPIDYDTIAARHAAEIDAQPWNAPTAARRRTR
jgi:hypothetical protein